MPVWENVFLPGESKVKSDGVRFYQKSCPAMLRLPVDRVRHSLGIPTSSLDEEPVFQLTSVNKIVHNTRLSVLSFQTAEKTQIIEKFWLMQPIMASTLCLRVYAMYCLFDWFDFLSKLFDSFPNQSICLQTIWFEEKIIPIKCKDCSIVHREQSLASDHKKYFHTRLFDRSTL